MAHSLCERLYKCERDEKWKIPPPNSRLCLLNRQAFQLQSTFWYQEQGTAFAFCAVQGLANPTSLHFIWPCCETSLGWGHGSVARVHALKAKSPEFDP